MRMTLAGIKMVIYRDSCVLCEENAFHISSERREGVSRGEHLNDLSALSALFDKTGALLGRTLVMANRVPGILK